MAAPSLCESFCIVLDDGTEVYPCRVRSRATGNVVFRVSKHGNESDESQEIADETELRQFVGGLGYRVRCKSKDGKRSGLYAGRGTNKIRDFKPIFRSIG